MKMNKEIQNYLVNVKTWKLNFDEYLNGMYVKFVPIDLKMWNSGVCSDDMVKEVNHLNLFVTWKRTIWICHFESGPFYKINKHDISLMRNWSINITFINSDFWFLLENSDCYRCTSPVLFLSDSIAVCFSLIVLAMRRLQCLIMCFTIWKICIVVYVAIFHNFKLQCLRSNSSNP
jgi:hypothetical protein